MNFGAILDKWEKQTAKAGVQKNDLIFPDEKPVRNEKSIPELRGIRRSRLLGKKPDTVIDLHGLDRNEAWIALESFFRNSRMAGYEKVLIIHGKGNHRKTEEGGIKDLTKNFIESCPLAGESGFCRAKEGGSGATWVILKDG